MRLAPAMLALIDVARDGKLDEAGRPLSRTGYIVEAIDRRLIADGVAVEGPVPEVQDAAAIGPTTVTRPSVVAATGRQPERVPARPRIRSGIHRWTEDR